MKTTKPHRIACALALAGMIPGGPALACGGPFWIDSFFSSVERPEDTALEFTDMVQVAVDQARARARLKGVFAESQRHDDESPGSHVWCEKQDLSAALASTVPQDHLRANAVASYIGAKLHARGATPGSTTGKTYEDFRDEVAGRAPAALPPAFRLYLGATAALSFGKDDEARATFDKILALPEADRRDREAAVRYTQASMTAAQDPAAGLARFDELTARVEAGLPDRCGLAARAALTGGVIALEAGEPADALRRFSAAMAAGYFVDRRTLSKVAALALQGDRAKLTALVKDPLPLAVLAAHVASDTDVNVYDRAYHQFSSWSSEREGVTPQNMPEAAHKLLDAAAAAKVETLPEAASLAWLAYRAGKADLAARFLDVASKEDPFRAWLAARLAMRKGDFRKARAQALYGWRLAVPRLGPSDYDTRNNTPYAQAQRWFEDHILRFLAREAAVAALSEARFPEAMGALMLGGFGTESVFVAERVMTTDELRKLVDAWTRARTSSDAKAVERLFDLPAGLCDKGANASPCPDDESFSGIRSALGRRLMRDGRYADAKAYFTDSMTLTGYEAFMKGAPQGLKSNKKPASMDAARAMLEAAGVWVDGYLSGTATDPDWHGAGSFYKRAEGGLVAMRERGKWTTPAELKRIKGSTPQPPKPRHYRYQALDMAWLATLAFPDGQEETAEALVRAGQWLKYDDPNAVQRFYKALVKRCPDTKLGQEAKERNWLP